MFDSQNYLLPAACCLKHHLSKSERKQQPKLPAVPYLLLTSHYSLLRPPYLFFLNHLLSRANGKGQPVLSWRDGAGGIWSKNTGRVDSLIKIKLDHSIRIRF